MGKLSGTRFFLFVTVFLLCFSSRLLAQEPLRAGTIFSATQAPLWAAREGRFFEKYGIKNLEVIQFSGGQPVTRALIGGAIQISTTGGAAVVSVPVNQRPRISRAPIASNAPSVTICQSPLALRPGPS